MDRSRDLFKSLNVSLNVWQGEGKTYMINKTGDAVRIGRVISARDSADSFIQKVYDWTVDEKDIMRKALRYGVDGIITNRPKLLIEVLGEPEFEGGFRLATIEDDPFSLYEDRMTTVEDYKWIFRARLNRRYHVKVQGYLDL